MRTRPGGGEGCGEGIERMAAIQLPMGKAAATQQVGVAGAAEGGISRTTGDMRGMERAASGHTKLVAVEIVLVAIKLCTDAKTTPNIAINIVEVVVVMAAKVVLRKIKRVAWYQ